MGREKQTFFYAPGTVVHAELINSTHTALYYTAIYYKLHIAVSALLAISAGHGNSRFYRVGLRM